MERQPAPTPALNHEAPKDAFDAALDEIEDGDAYGDDSFASDKINDALDETIDGSDAFATLEGPGNTYLPEDPDNPGDPNRGPYKMPLAYSEVGGTGPEVDEQERKTALAEAEKDALREAEASLVLRGSQRLDKYVLEHADQLMQRGEKVAAKVGDKKHAAKDQYLQWRIDSTQRKKDRYTEKATTAAFGFRRRKFARKARLLNRRLTGLNGFQTADRNKYTKIIDTEKSGKDGKTELVKGERTLRREARAEQLQGRINRMIAAEYKLAKIGREDRKQTKLAMKGEGNPAKRETLRRLLVDSGSVEKLETVGRKMLVDRLMKANFKNENVRSMAIFAVNQFAEAVQEHRQGRI